MIMPTLSYCPPLVRALQQNRTGVRSCMKGALILSTQPGVTKTEAAVGVKLRVCKAYSALLRAPLPPAAAPARLDCGEGRSRAGHLQKSHQGNLMVAAQSARYSADDRAGYCFGSRNLSHQAFLWQETRVSPWSDKGKYLHVNSVEKHIMGIVLPCHLCWMHTLSHVFNVKCKNHTG